MTQTSAYPDAADRIVVSSRSGAFFRSAAARLWPWSDWIVLVVTAAALYPMFGRSSDMGPFYGAAARCVLRGEALLTCLPQYPYQPALALFFIPLAFLPAILQRLIWYVVCIGCLVIAVRLIEAIAERLYPRRHSRHRRNPCRSAHAHARHLRAYRELSPACRHVKRSCRSAHHRFRLYLRLHAARGDPALCSFRGDVVRLAASRNRRRG